jgi:Protein of unknown function (DUF4235)
MSGKRAGGGSRILSAVAGFAASFVARKLIQFAWKKITGREPPEPDDPQVGLGEAIAWVAIAAVSVQLARMLATRATSRRAVEPEEPPQA